MSFHNFSPCSTTHFFISFILKKRCKMVEFVENSLKGKYDTNNTLQSNKIMKYLCTPQNACLCRYAIVNFTVGAFICQFFFPTVLVIQKEPIARKQVASTLRNNNGEQESISLLQILRKMVRINYCGNFTTFSITLVSPIEISLLK